MKAEHWSMASRRGMGIQVGMMVVLMMIDSWVGVKDTYLVGGYVHHSNIVLVMMKMMNFLKMTMKLTYSKRYLSQL
jgi:hypothetical protein